MDKHTIKMFAHYVMKGYIWPYGAVNVPNVRENRVDVLAEPQVPEGVSPAAP